MWKDLLNQSGFGRDESGCITADPAVLEAYFKAHPEARRFRTAALKFEEQLDVLFQDVLATGEYAYTLADLMPVDPILQQDGKKPEIENSIEVEDVQEADDSLSTTSYNSSASSKPKKKRLVDERGKAARKSSKRAVTEKLTESITEIIEVRASRRNKQDVVSKAVELFFAEFTDLDVESQVLLVNEF